jgi:hypothetical protein
MTAKEAKEIWLNILKRQRRIPRCYRTRLKRLRFTRGGGVLMYKKYKRKGKEVYLKELNFEFAERHFPSLLKLLQKAKDKYNSR